MDGPLHLQKAENNLALAHWLDDHRPDCADWRVTVHFYSVLHLVDACLHRYGRGDPVDHYERALAVQAVFPQQYRKHYRHLLNLSLRARYTELQIDEGLWRTVLTNHYEPLVGWLRKDLGR